MFACVYIEHVIWKYENNHHIKKKFENEIIHDKFDANSNRVCVK